MSRRKRIRMVLARIDTREYDFLRRLARTRDESMSATIRHLIHAEMIWPRKPDLRSRRSRSARLAS